MAKKKRARKSGPVWHLSAEEATLSEMPKYNGHACGSGVHGDTKYNRTKQKRAWKQQVSQEARTRGPLLLGHDRAMTGDGPNVMIECSAMNGVQWKDSEDKDRI